MSVEKAHNPLEYMHMGSKRHKQNFYADIPYHWKRETHWYSTSAWLLPHIPGKSVGRRWLSVALCGQPGQWQGWAGAPSFLGREEEEERKDWDLAVPTSDKHIDFHKHWLDHRVSEAASGTMRWLFNGEESVLCQQCMMRRRGGAQVERVWWHLVTLSC